jgi:hypothetical protein
VASLAGCFGGVGILEGAMKSRPLICVTFLLNLSSFSYALAPADLMADWICTSSEERRNVASLLVAVAGQGEQEVTEEFFEHCLDDLAHDLEAKRIRDVANGCMLMRSVIFSEDE